MTGQHVVILVLLGLGAVSAGLFGHSLDHLHKELKKINLNKLVDIGGKKVTSLEAVGMSWSNCGGAGDIVKINSLSVGPDPLSLPGTVQLGFDVTVSTNITNPVSIDLDIKIKKKVIGWVKVPCIDHKGSCKYDDVCPSTHGRDCPAVFGKYGIPCSCPIKQGHYTLPVTSIDVDHISIPSFLKHDEFKIRARVAEASGAELMCVDAEFSLK